MALKFRIMTTFRVEISSKEKTKILPIQKKTKENQRKIGKKSETIFNNLLFLITYVIVTESYAC